MIAMADDKPKPKPAAKPAVKKGKVEGIWNVFEKSGEALTRKNHSCPKCGQGFFMAKHKDRWSCGQCHYTEFLTSSEQQKPEVKK